MRKILFVIVSFLALCNVAHAAGPDRLSDYTNSGKTMHYIRAGATGAADGSNWTDAWTDLPGTFTRDHIYFVAGGSYGTHSFNTAASGTDIIYIVAATEADHGTDTGWSDSYDDSAAIFSAAQATVWAITTPYWVFDGQERTTWTTGYHLKVWNSSTSLGDCYLVTVTNDNADNISFDYVEMENYDSGWNTYGGDEPSQTMIRASVYDADNFTISHNYWHEHERYAAIHTRASDNWVVEYSYFKQIRDKEFWSGGNESDHIVRYNIFEDCAGSMLLGVVSGYWDGLDFHGNLVFFTGCNPGMGEGLYDYTDGLLADVSGSTGCANWNVYNNTFVDIVGGNRIGCNYGSGSTNIDVRNNIFYNTVNGSCVANSPSFSSGVTHDYNADDGDLGETNDQDSITSGIFADYANDDFSLSGATDAGDTSIGAAYNTDLNGVTRGNDSNWDRGYLEYDAGGGGSSQNLPGGTLSGVSTQ